MILVDTDIERKRCAAIVRRSIVRNKNNIMHVQILKRVLEKIVNPRKPKCTESQVTSPNLS
jgi:hypothetical protein